MNLGTKRFGLVLAGLIAVGAVASLAIGASFALFSSTPTGVSDSITAGTVTLANPASTSCTFNNIAPGDQPTTCTYTVDYTGSLDAWILVNASVTSTAGPTAVPTGDTSTAGGTDLYDTSANGLQISITGYSSLGVAWNNGYAYNIDQDFSPSATLPQVVYGLASCLNCVSEYFTPNTTETFTVNAALPSWASNQYQGGSATVTLQASAVQYANNNGNDCYRGPCSEQTNESNAPFVTDAIATSSPSSLTLGYDEDVTFPGDLNLANFTVTDISQSTGTTAGATCAVTAASGSGTQDVTLTLAKCSDGNFITSGDYLDFSYDSNSSASVAGFPQTSGPFIGSTIGGIQADTSLSLIPVS
ncbi:MAG: hypothetical protein ACRENX_06535 [Candidatus Dormibacteria bacterium]